MLFPRVDIALEKTNRQYLGQEVMSWVHQCVRGDQQHPPKHRYQVKGSERLYISALTATSLPSYFGLLVLL